MRNRFRIKNVGDSRFHFSLSRSSEFLQLHTTMAPTPYCHQTQSSFYFYTVYYYNGFYLSCSYNSSYSYTCSTSTYNYYYSQNCGGSNPDLLVMLPSALSMKRSFEQLDITFMQIDQVIEINSVTSTSAYCHVWCTLRQTLQDTYE